MVWMTALLVFAVAAFHVTETGRWDTGMSVVFAFVGLVVVAGAVVSYAERRRA